MSYPAMMAVPLVIDLSPVRMLKVVVFPAPAYSSRCGCLVWEGGRGGGVGVYASTQKLGLKALTLRCAEVILRLFWR